AAGVIEDPLGRLRLTGIDVGHDADISRALVGRSAGHDELYSLKRDNNDNATRHGWPPPSGAYLPPSLPPSRHSRRRRAALPTGDRPWSLRAGRARSSPASGWPAPGPAPDAPRPGPDRWRRRRGATAPRCAA